MFIFKLEILYLIGPDHFLTYVVKILYMFSFFFIFSYIKINFQFFYILIFIIKYAHFHLKRNFHSLIEVHWVELEYLDKKILAFSLT